MIGRSAEVSKDEFYAATDKLDIVSRVMGTYPFVTEVYSRSGHVIGYIAWGRTNEPNHYYLVDLLTQAMSKKER